ncbi:acetate--CoA ligase family protein [Propylenella binzhouense]|uniref:CoA-binding protein n=1 Tax=Propylenella binzhouense TaxID=2555902 RepID=A0A964T267_9HYPH|nr:acetate--CoA ligase family protein [Propylenella binzhouense]MYZ46885.1 CoA-binding protein [Propylenella binzhouense]
MRQAQAVRADPPAQSDAAGTLLNPRSIAIVGASDRSRWSSMLVQNLDATGFEGRLALVNPKGGTVHGRPAARSCAEIGAGIDLGVVVVPQDAVIDVVAELAEAGARSAMVLTSGFAETGEEGAERQRRLVETARARGVRLLGPNSLGFINLAENVFAWATPLRPLSRREGVGIVSQSGATALFLADLAHEQDIGLSHVIATGNEADLDGTVFLDYLVDHPATRSIAVFLETIRDPAAFIRSAERALASGKPLVALKVGASEVTARSAEAHTGALVGDDRVFEGICRQYGIIRVSSVEDLLVTADIAARTGMLRPGGLAVLSNSGGICEIAADRADACGLMMPELSGETSRKLRELIPGFGTPHNPLDLTGGIDPLRTEQIVRLIGGQEDYAAVLCPYYPVPSTPDQINERLTALHDGLSRGLKGLDIPGLLVSYTNAVVTDLTRSIVAKSDMPYHACGLDRALTALAGIARWSERKRSFAGRENVAAAVEGAGQGQAARPRSEHEALAFLAGHGVPVVPAHLVRSREEAAAAAAAIGGPAVVKIASPDIAHKSDIGGVILNLDGEEAVAEGFARVVEAARERKPEARIDGALVLPMRQGGLELFVGCSRDPQWGPVLAVGLGGIFVEVLKDVSLRLLPVSEAEVRRMLGELRGKALLDGQRGIPPADLDAVAAAVAAIGRAALSAGPELAALDVNPLWVRGDRVEALDAYFDWNAG